MAGEVFSYFIAVDPVVTALPLPAQNADRIPVVRGTYPNQATFYVSPQDVGGGSGTTTTYSHVQPLTGDTLTATAGLGAFVIDPAAGIATLAVVLPPTPANGDVFELSTSQTITALTITAPGGAGVVGGGPFTQGLGGASWRFVASNNFWYRRY